MKKTIICLLTVVISFSTLSAGEKFTNNLSFSFFQGNHEGKLPVSLFETDEEEAGLDYEKFARIDTALKYLHASFAGITYAGFWAADATGIALLYHTFNETSFEYYDALKWSHIGIMIPSLVSFGAMVTLAFTKLGMKVKYDMPIRKTHLAAAFVVLGAYIAELTMMIIGTVFLARDLPGKKWADLAHGINCGVTTLAISVSLVTIFF